MVKVSETNPVKLSETEQFKALKNPDTLLSVKNALKELMEECSDGAFDGGMFEKKLTAWITTNEIDDPKFKLE